MLKKLSLMRERVENWKVYPFTVPVIASLAELEFASRICLLTGENGSGKSTLLEAIAGHYGFGREGGNRNFGFNTTASNQAIDPLVKVLRLSFDKRTGAGFFLRAESFFNVASHVDEVGVLDVYGGVSLHSRSHGESFLALFRHKFNRDGLFLMDEPEAALSPQRQLSLLVLIHDVLKRVKNAQFIISTHSPMLLGYPGAQILSFDEGVIHRVEYEQTPPVQIVRSFMNHRDSMLDELFADSGSLFNEEDK